MGTSVVGHFQTVPCVTSVSAVVSSITLAGIMRQLPICLAGNAALPVSAVLYVYSPQIFFFSTNGHTVFLFYFLLFSSSLSSFSSLYSHKVFFSCVVCFCLGCAASKWTLYSRSPFLHFKISNRSPFCFKNESINPFYFAHSHLCQKSDFLYIRLL